MIKVLVVEDQKMAQDNMVGYINASENYTLAGTLTNAALAETFCLSNDVDLILMDVCTEHDENGIDQAAIIKKNFPKIKIIIVTSMAEYTYLNKARQAKVDSFWYKNVSSECLISVMDRTMNGESIYPEKTPEVKLGLTTSYHLTEAEMNTLRVVMESADYKEAGERLGVSQRTIRFHMGNILEKTGYRTRLELLMAVVQKNLIITTPDKNIE